LRHPVVLRLGLFGMLTIGAFITLALSTPLLLKEATGLDPIRIGWIVSAAGALGAIGILIGGWHSDRRGERFSTMLASTTTIAFMYLVIAGALGWSPVVLVGAFLLLNFAWTSVTNANVMLWPDLLHPRQLAVGSAAINTMSQVGAFAMPFAWGAAKDATGSYHAGLVGLSVASFAAVMIALLLSRQVGRAARDRIAAVAPA
jgi:ACS family tartrate transporter-like MFS transporter